MKISFTIGFIIIILLIQPIDSSGNFPDSGTYTSLDTGTERPFDRYFGKILLVEAFATWCLPCKSEMNELNEVNKVFGDNITIFSLSVSPGTDTTSKIANFRKEAEDAYSFKATWEFGLDQDSIYSEELHILTIPMTVLYDTDGSIIQRWDSVVNASSIGSFINANVTFPERSEIDVLLTTLRNSTLFIVTASAIVLLISYRIIIPRNPNE